ncbi:cytochrome P450 703A2-like [Cryptomeria japonica]|uniref:cytochrome P450 703A2-like n=1 Tax=Cryptomeria japonica TaxID=3369 RepID=UPI0027DA074E|nr:cytochrome P450 703A2-like [Cryptomeria japonica]
MVPVVVTDDPKYVKEFLLKQDHLFASRPKNIASEHFTFGGNDIAFAPYGPHWKEVRRICLMELLSPKKIESFRQGRVEEVQCMVNDVYRASLEGKSINMRNLFGILTSNVITRMVLGQRFFGLKGASPEVAVEHKAKIYDSFSLINAFNIGDYLPFLRPLDLQGHERKMKDIMKWVEKLYGSIIQEQFLELEKRSGVGPLNFVHTLLEAKSRAKTLNMMKVKAILIDIFAAGTDTSSITSEWAMAELLRHPEYMTKVREEIDVVVGHGHHVEESDLVHLRYLRAVVKEVFRLHPVGGFLIPHISMKDTKIKGFDIPKNTKVLINTYSLGRNPKVWSNPNDFDPKRFITNDKDCVEFNDPDCKIVPFGAGRRGCPGATLGMKVVLLCLARLIHLFNWSPLYKEKLEDSDMVEVLGYTIKSVPLEANAKPRLGSLLL